MFVRLSLVAVNPYWEIVKDLPEEKWKPKWLENRFVPESFPDINPKTYTPDDFLEAQKVSRRELVRKYSWAIPEPGVIEWLVIQLAGKPVLEIGAGTGYWAWQLAQHGVDVIAYDLYPVTEKENDFHPKVHNPQEFYPVLRGSVEVGSCYPERALFLCWPPYANSFAHDALEAYHGDTLVFCGEEWGGCTGGDDFFELLAKEWHEVARNDNHPQWSGIHDELIVYQRGTA